MLFLFDPKEWARTTVGTKKRLILSIMVHLLPCIYLVKLNSTSNISSIFFVFLFVLFLPSVYLYVIFRLNKILNGTKEKNIIINNKKLSIIAFIIGTSGFFCLLSLPTSFNYGGLRQLLVVIWGALIFGGVFAVLFVSKGSLKKDKSNESNMNDR